MSCDSEGNVQTGNKIYKLHLQSGIPASLFWSIIVYDSDTGIIIKTDQSWPSVFSTRKDLVYNTDGSVDIWFGPETPGGKGQNFVKTILYKKWHAIMRLYYPMESLIDKTWVPGKIEYTGIKIG